MYSSAGTGQYNLPEILKNKPLYFRSIIRIYVKKKRNLFSQTYNIIGFETNALASLCGLSGTFGHYFVHLDTIIFLFCRSVFDIMSSRGAKV